MEEEEEEEEEEVEERESWEDDEEEKRRVGGAVGLEVQGRSVLDYANIFLTKPTFHIGIILQFTKP